ncbi:HAD family hydrolase [Thaumasiovibrio sp. DFM-14]|uniref:HAD family hydrolase n=1 Tax=Thaumasiovibrio sp. DFM-14 TaxID=3384792 RepID=UPI00399FE391
MKMKTSEAATDLVVFDMDETLIGNDLTVLWHTFVVEELKMADEQFLAQDKEMMDLYYQGEMDLDDYMAFSLSPLRSLTAEQVDALADRYVSEQAAQYIFPQANALLAELQKRNVTCMIISASASFLVKAMGRYLGIPSAEGVDLEIENGYYTGKIDGIPSYQYGKVIRLQRWLETSGGSYSSIHFYSDSINDLPLLLEVDHPIVVNGCPQLQSEAASRGWPQLEWQLCEAG